MLVKVETDVISTPAGHLAVQHVALEHKQEPLPTHVPTLHLSKPKSAPILKDIMVPGPAGLPAVPHVAVDTRPEANHIHVAGKIMFKNELVTKTQVIMVPGVNGVIVLLHVVVAMLFGHVFTDALARFKPIPNSVTPIPALIMVPGLIGHLAVPHVALEPCHECDIVTVDVLVTDFVSMVTCQQMK